MRSVQFARAVVCVCYLRVCVVSGLYVDYYNLKPVRTVRLGKHSPAPETQAGPFKEWSGRDSDITIAR